MNNKQYLLSGNSVLLSDAVPGAGRERDVGERISLLGVLWEKSVRVKGLRLRVNGWVAVEEKFAEDHVGSGRDSFTLNDEILPQDAGDDGDTLVESRTTNTNTVQSDPVTT